MIARINFDGTDVTDRVLRRGVAALTAETQDEEGAQTMGSVKMAFSNMDGFFNDYRDVIDPVPVHVGVGNTRLFLGQTDPENSVDNLDSEIFSVECTSEDRVWLDRMKALRLSESAADVNRILAQVFAEDSPSSSPINVEGRWFWTLESLLEHLTIPAVPVDLQIAGVDLAHYLLGGRAFNLDLRLPDITAAQLVKDVAQMFNAMYYMDSGTLVIRDRASFLASSDTPLNPQLIRGTYKGTTRRCGLDRVSYEFANADQNKTVYQYAYFGGHAISRDPYGLDFPMSRQVRSSFLQANTDERVRFYQETAFISRADNDNDSLYLVKNSSGLYSGAGNRDVPPVEPLAWYECEFRGLMEWEASYFIDDEATLGEVIKPLRLIQHPLGRRTINVIRSAQIDLDSETVAIKAMEFKPS